MKTTYGLGASSVAIAMSLSAAAHAQDATVSVEADAETVVLFEDVSPDAEPTATQTEDDSADPDQLLTVKVAPLPAAQVMSIPPIAAPMSISPAAQDAILAVDFPADMPSGLITTPGLATSPVAHGVVTARSITPNYGDIDAFYGDIVAFYGDIDAFWRDINPFYGDIDAFYGDIDAFWRDINPFYGDIDAFWGDIDAFYGDIDAFDSAHLASIGDWGQQAKAQVGVVENHWSSLKYSTGLLGDVSITFDGTPNRIRNSLETLIAQGEAQFGAAYTAKTGKSFRDGFVAELLARHGLDLADSGTAKKTLAKTEAERAAFFLDWHDSLMQYAGIDAIDHWMGMVNWTPSITQIQGEGRQTIIGIVDGSFAADADLSDNIAWSGGGTTTVNGHGAGVASLIAGAHDGEGVMGIAPKVKIATYNPFDADNTASWDSVRNGIDSLIFSAYVGGNKTGYVSIINLSLGEKGWTFAQGMADVFSDKWISRYHHETLYVLAAGNDGVSQTADVDYDFSRDASFIVVGSVDANGQISGFSNRPGSACLLDGGVCHAGNELANRFVVAPGSLLLVSDGAGGVTRASGTSFAAPLVSGAVSLLHDRWSWLVRHPEETAEIIFRSARDLGAPGVDEVYGHGLLDVAASQSPLNFGDLRFTMYGKGGAATSVAADSLLATGIPNSWNTDGVFFTAFEDIGSTYRDFAIPMSSLKRGQSSDVLGHGVQRMQDFVADRFANWLLSGGADKDGDGALGVSQVRSNEAETRGLWNMRYQALPPRFTQDGAVRPVHNAATLTSPDGKMSFTLGHGQGALALSGGQFGIMSDHNAETGGVNPVLGLASGEVFAGASYNIASKTKVSVGFSAERQDWQDLDIVSDIERQRQRALGAREAQAMTVALEQNLSDAISVNAQWTHLNEQDAVLGVQTGNNALLGEGSQTNAMTVSANVKMGDGLSFDLSMTGAATEANDGQLLVSNDRALSTAGQFSINKRGVMGNRDILRVSVGQPLTVERGELELRSEQVIDRETGEIGIVSQFIGIDTRRRYMGELVYATPVTANSEFGVVARYVSEGGVTERESVLIGANFGLRF